MRERERERERERDRQRQRQTETDRQTDRQIETERQRDYEKVRLLTASGISMMKEGTLTQTRANISLTTTVLRFASDQF